MLHALIGRDYAPHLARVFVGGHELTVVDRVELVAQMIADCEANRQAPAAPRLIFDANGQSVSMASTNPDFAAAMGRADMIHADGMSLVLASRLLTERPLPERIAVTDFVHDAAAAAEERGLSFFLLGGDDARNLAACEELIRRYPRLRIVGRHHGYFPESDSARICEMVRRSGADVLWVGMGRPLQETWSVAHRDELHGVAWVKTCGGLFGFLAAEEPRAPQWMQRVGLEWLFRMLRDPRRLTARYLITNPHAIYLFMRRSQKARNGVQVS